MTLAETDCEGSAVVVAVTVAAKPAVTGGAVYSPCELIVPTVEFPPGIALTDQMTPMFEGPAEIANSSLAPGPIAAT